MIRDYGQPVSPVRQAWENGGRQFDEARRYMVADQFTPSRSPITSNGFTDMRYVARDLQVRQVDTIQGYPPVVRRGCGCTQTALEREVTAEYNARKEQQAAQPSPVSQPLTVHYANGWVRAYEPDPAPAAPKTLGDYWKEAAQQPVKRPAVTIPVVASEPEPAGEILPPDMPPAEWRLRHFVGNDRRPTPETISHVPVETETEPQLVVTPAGFRYAERFNHLEIRR